MTFREKRAVTLFYLINQATALVLAFSPWWELRLMAALWIGAALTLACLMPMGVLLDDKREETWQRSTTRPGIPGGNIPSTGR